MKKALVLALVLFAICSLTEGVLAFGPLQQAASIITSPADNAVVRATVPIVGSAIDPDFWKYEVYFATEPNPGDQWTFIGAVHEKQVTAGLLETWHTNAIPDGRYSLRLRIVNRTGNYRDIFVRGILVANAAPTETPIPTEVLEATPTATITPAATPTFIMPTSALAQPTATPTLARPSRTGLTDVLDVNAWRRSFCLGAELMAGILVVLGLVFALRRRS
jgi:hypothetical protein